MSVFVIPPESSGPPTPNEDTLRAVCSTLARAGVEVVAAAPLYHTVRLDVSVVIDPSVSRGQAVQQVIAAINGYMDPITGGDDG